MATTTATYLTWKQHWCITGWYMTARFWFFKREYFVCSECGRCWDKRDHRLHLKLFKAKEALRNGTKTGAPDAKQPNEEDK